MLLFLHWSSIIKAVKTGGAGEKESFSADSRRYKQKEEE